MSKEKTFAAKKGGALTFFQSLGRAAIYKRSQGKIARQVTFAVIAISFIIASWRFYVFVSFSNTLTSLFGLVPQSLQERTHDFGMVILPCLLLGCGVWGAYRIVNFPRFADFLIAVEAEMNKVSWPSRQELVRSSIVVIFVIFFMAVMLYTFDLLWRLGFTWMGVLSS